MDVIDRIIDRLPEAEADINDFLTRSLAIFMLLRLVKDNIDVFDS